MPTPPASLSLSDDDTSTSLALFAHAWRQSRRLTCVSAPFVMAQATLRSRYEAPNLRTLADKTAATGFYVVVPDFFYGDPYVLNTIPIQSWIERHGVDKGFEDAKLVVEALSGKGFSLIGASGFCWGGKVIAELAKFDLIKAGVMLHPSRVTIDDIKANKAHLAVLGAEIDKTSPPELVKQFEEILSVNSELESYVKIFPGVSHGWTLRYDVNDAAAASKADEAHTDMINWYLKHLK